MTTPTLRLTELVVDYGGVKAVDHVSLHLEPGKLYGLIGPNGSGKTSLLGAVSRVGRLSSGRVVLNGVDYTDLPAKMAALLGIARSFQTVRLLDNLTVIENVMLGADKRVAERPVLASWLGSGRWAAERESRQVAMEMIERMGLTAVRNRYPNTLSYGTQRRVEIARCLAGRPKLLLLDEPTAGMSRAETDEIGQLMMDLRATGLTQLLVAHDLPMIHAVTDHIFAFNFGRLIAEGPSTTVASDPAVREAYLGQSDTLKGTGEALQ